MKRFFSKSKNKLLMNLSLRFCSSIKSTYFVTMLTFTRQSISTTINGFFFYKKTTMNRKNDTFSMNLCTMYTYYHEMLLVDDIQNIYVKVNLYIFKLNFFLKQKHEKTKKSFHYCFGCPNNCIFPLQD